MKMQTEIYDWQTDIAVENFKLYDTKFVLEYVK